MKRRGSSQPTGCGHMKRRAAVWINSRLLSYDVDGACGPPGYGDAQRWCQANGSEILIIDRGPAFDLYVGKKSFFNFAVDKHVLYAIIRWVIWHWLAHDWMGLKSSLWHKSFSELMIHDDE
jgi:hypothetical protein